MPRFAPVLTAIILAGCQSSAALAPPASLPPIPESSQLAENELVLSDSPGLFKMLDVEHEGSYRWELVSDSTDGEPSTAVLAMVFHGTQQPPELVAAMTDEAGTRRLGLTPTRGWTEGVGDQTTLSRAEVEELRGFFDPGALYQVAQAGAAHFEFEAEESIGGVSIRRYSSSLEELTPVLATVEPSVWMFFLGGPITTPAEPGSADLIELWVNPDGRIVGMAAETHRGDTSIVGEWHIWPSA